jgi:hypothetical protein
MLVFKMNQEKYRSIIFQVNRKQTNDCELSLGPEVAILFGREIGQSNGDILLTI